MPLIQCTGCAAAFKVDLKTIGRTVKCPKCRSSFQATVKRSGPRMKQKSAAPYWMAGAGAALIIVVLIATTLKKDPPPSTGSGEKAAASTASSGGGSVSGGSPSSTPADVARDRSRVEDTVREFIDAVQDENVQALKSLLSFPSIQDARAAAGEAPKWAELDDTQAVFARQEITEGLLGDTDARVFLRQAKIDKLETPQLSDQRAKVYLLLISLLDEKTQQERHIDLLNISGKWFVAGQQAGPIEDPEKVAAQSKVAERETTRRRGRDRLGEIVRVENLADTPADLQATIDTLVAKVGDLTLTREASKARRELVEIGKPAIPALLNLIVDHKDMDDQDNQQIANVAVQGLREITLLDHGFAPGGPTGSLTGDTDTEEGFTMETALRRWFGWWRDKKDTWTGPIVPDDEGSEDG